jgi:hypothetical protein
MNAGARMSFRNLPRAAPMEAGVMAVARYRAPTVFLVRMKSYPYQKHGYG